MKNKINETKIMKTQPKNIILELQEIIKKVKDSGGTLNIDKVAGDLFDKLK